MVVIGALIRRGRAGVALVAALLLGGGAPRAPASPGCVLQLFFSSADPFAGTGRTAPSLPGNVAGVVGSTLNTPPLSNPAIDSGRLWIWGAGTLGDPDPSVWNGISVGVLIDGPAAITGGGMLNITSPSVLRRWETGSDLTPPTFNLIAVTRNGLQLPPVDDGFGDRVANVLLGYLDFEANGGASTVWFQVGTSGISGDCGGVSQPFVRFGVGDESLRGDDFGRTSTLPDAYIGVVEPSSAMLVLAGAAALGHAVRRRSLRRAQVSPAIRGSAAPEETTRERLGSRGRGGPGEPAGSSERAGSHGRARPRTDATARGRT